MEVPEGSVVVVTTVSTDNSHQLAAWGRAIVGGVIGALVPAVSGFIWVGRIDERVKQTIIDVSELKSANYNSQQRLNLIEQRLAGMDERLKIVDANVVEIKTTMRTMMGQPPQRRTQ